MSRKRIVRVATFETNSSTTHSYAYLSKEAYEQWKQGEMYVYLDNANEFVYYNMENPPENGRLYTRAEVLQFIEDAKASAESYEGYDEDYNIYWHGFLNYEDYVQEDTLTLTEPTDKYTLIRTYHD